MNISSTVDCCNTIRNNRVIAERQKTTAEEIKGERGVLKYLPTSSLFVDPEYQRPKVKKHITKIANSWDWRKVKCLNVALRQDMPGMFFVYDGQHTCLAARERGIEELPCYIIQVDSLAEEAIGFAGINRDRRAVSTAVTFKAMVKGEDPRAMRLNKILDKYGITLTDGKTTKPLHSYAVGTLLQIMEESSSKCSLDRVLSVIVAAWEGEQPSLYGGFVFGLWSFLNRVGTSLSDKVVSKELGKHSAKSIHQRAMLLSRAKSNSGSCSSTDIWREVFLDCYNHGKRNPNRLSFDTVAE